MCALTSPTRRRGFAGLTAERGRDGCTIREGRRQFEFRARSGAEDRPACTHARGCCRAARGRPCACSGQRGQRTATWLEIAGRAAAAAVAPSQEALGCGRVPARRRGAHRFYGAPRAGGRDCEEDHPRGHARRVRLVRRLARRDDRRSAPKPARAPQPADMGRLGRGQRRDGARGCGPTGGPRHAARPRSGRGIRAGRRGCPPRVRISGVV